MHKNRDAWVEIDLGNLERNIEIINGWLLDSPGEHKICSLMGIVKADAYGHGAIAIAEVLQAMGVSWLGVASVGEGQQLRAAGIHLPILILGPSPRWSILTAIENNLDLAVTSLTQLIEISRQSSEKNKICHIQLKIDTGMHRLGFQPDSLSDVFKILDNQTQLKLTGVFSHLAKADDEQTTKRQDAVFKTVLKMFEAANHRPQLVHLASSEAARQFPFVRYDMVRMGINLYGLEATTVSSDLLPVMAVRGRINQLNYVEAGQAIGYGLTWRAERKTLLASIPVGYADGIDRRLSNRMRGLINGNFVNQVGRISMDQLLFDVTDIEGVEEGDVVTLIGSQFYGNRQNVDSSRPTINLADWSALLNTITYELACRLKIRLPYVFSRTNSRQALEQGKHL